MAYTGPDVHHPSNQPKEIAREERREEICSRNLQNYWRERFRCVILYIFVLSIGMSGPYVCITIFVPGVSSIHLLGWLNGHR